MAQTPNDIAKLEQMYINGESDKSLSDQAILIITRVRLESAFVYARGDTVRGLSLDVEVQQFKDLLQRISGRSTTHDVFALFRKFLREQKIMFDF